MDGAQVGVLKETHQVSLTSFLKSHHSGALEPQVSLEILSNFSHQSLEWKFADEELCGLLVSSDLAESNSSRPVAMRLLHTSSSWGRLPCGLGGQLLPGQLRF